ncbi:hypothetical protein KIN20_001924 [Parelaphostrongylus tenuis]|uniref:Uncharacterized protein n=1 Tax=Parelaphostrongylus tenuis TaxID=148309 RepID=A0AAD5QGG6_PARTN|nr:hypothetical protein KIN20_001924 [Parelaphostrongylus tenuis]
MRVNMTLSWARPSNGYEECLCVSYESKKQRITVNELRKTGMKTADIVKIDWFQTNKCLQSYETFQKNGEIEDHARKRRPVTSSISENIRRIQRPLQQYPEHSMRRDGREFWDQLVDRLEHCQN